MSQDKTLTSQDHKVRSPKEGEGLEAYLKNAYGLPKALISKLFRKRLIKVNGRRAPAKTLLSVGDQIDLPHSITADVTSARAPAKNLKGAAK